VPVGAAVVPLEEYQQLRQAMQEQQINEVQNAIVPMTSGQLMICA
jgi:hypothetical protein